MPCVTIQFHMLFDELIDFVATMMSRYSLAVELEAFFPKKLTVVAESADLTSEVERFGQVDRIWLLCRPPRARKFERFNLHVGRIKGKRLEQSHLGAGTKKVEAFKILKSVA